MIRDLKSLISYVSNKTHYRHVRIGFGSRLTGSTVAGAGVQIGRDCYIYRSTLANGVMIKDGCSIFDAELGNNTAIYPHTSLSDVRFGAYSYVNENSMMRGVTIGKFSSIGPHFLCGYGEHPTNFVTTSPAFYSTRRQSGVSFAETSRFDEQRETTLGSDVWIGTRVFVRDGVKIGNGALIAAGAVVTRDIADYAVVGGVPAKLIRFRFPEEVIRELLEIQWWNWSDDKLREAQPLLSQPDVNAFLAWTKRT